ncbi:DUF2339 domain-containing protein [Nocardia nepalensis]|uniref:DUF2339 domain-containing protein n=1 Tax=Nocardia nepalensis TaxID=3375448 RepID=UPI003B66DB8A
MTTSIDPALISRLSGEFTALGTQMGVLGRDLELLRCQIAASSVAALGVSKDSADAQAAEDAPDSSIPVPRGASPDAPAAAAPSKPDAGSGTSGTAGSATHVPPVAPSGWGQFAPGYGPGYVRPGAVPGGAAVPPGGPVPPSGYRPPMATPQWSGVAGPPGIRPPRPPVRGGAGVPRTPWWQREGMISRVLAVAGVAVTLIGVVMLLVLAAQAGFFGPVPRVVAGAGFSVALVGVGVRVFGRAGGRVGGIALAATGIAGAYLDVVAVTAIYGWLHPVLGLAVALAVAAGGVGLAMRWQSQPLAVLVVVGAAVLSPFVTSELVLLAFLIVLQLTCVPVQLARDWPFLHVVRTVPVTLATLVAIAVATLGDPAQGRVYWVLTAAVAIVSIGLVGGVLVVRKRSGDIVAALTFALSTVPLLTAPAMFERHSAALVAGIYAAVLLAVAASRTVPKLPELVRIPGSIGFVAAIAGSFALLEACIGVTQVRTLPIALLLVALCYLGLAGQQRSRVTAAIGVAFTVVGAMAYFATVTPEALATQRIAQERMGIPTALGAVLALAVIATAVWCARRLPGMRRGGSDESTLFVVASIAGLYAVTAATVSIGIATTAADGFIIGHSAATIIWMAAATGALLFGLRNLSGSAAVAKLALGSGLLVTAAALAKLFLFDLATLDGLVRVAAFLIVGILLLLAGTRYARAFAEAGATNRNSENTTN